MDVRMWTKRIALVALALFVAGCGPKTEEVGGAIMIATPLALLAMILPTLILRKVSRLSPRMSTGRDFLPLSVAIIGAMSASMVGALQYFSFSEDIELLGIAAIAASSSAMLYGMISWAFTERRRPEQPYGRFLLPTLLLTHIIPSALLLFHHQLVYQKKDYFLLDIVGHNLIFYFALLCKKLFFYNLHTLGYDNQMLI